MKIERFATRIEIYADDGKAVCRKSDVCEKSTMASVSIPISQLPDDWRDCEYGDDDVATEADKDAALRRFGVEV